MTTLDLLNASARLIGVLASGETLSANQSTDALTSLNNMIETWSLESLLVYASTPETFTLVQGQQTYNWGAGGDFNSARPVNVENAYLNITNGSTVFNPPVNIIDQDQWSNISVKSIQSNIPTVMFPLMSNPMAVMYIWPIPAAAVQMVVWSMKQLSSLTSLNTTLAFPPGYQRALTYGLALEIAPEYGVQPSELVVLNAAESKGAIKRANKKAHLLTTDAALQPHKPIFNWLTGE